LRRRTMKLRELGEFGLIERIRKIVPMGQGVRLGIGDDAAWIRCQQKSLLFTSDLLLEGVHFDLRWTSFYTLGYKTLAVNLSDIAAMGGRPSYLALSLGIPVDFEVKDVEEFYRGIVDLSSQCGVSLVGGDTSASKRFFISAALMGFAPYGPILRNGAKVGDDLYVTGTLGDSALGLKLLKKRRPSLTHREATYLVSRHLAPTARLKAGAVLARKKLAKAMIDVSDGLVQDLNHLCQASKVGAIVREESLPLSRAYRRSPERRGILEALTGGEDYELLFAVRPRDRGRLKKVERSLGVPVTRIGKCVPPAEGVKVLDPRGEPRPLSVLGYDHFHD